MNRIFQLMLAAGMLLALPGSLRSQTLASSISETINFLQSRTGPVNTVRAAYVEFALVDNFADFGIITGRAKLEVQVDSQLLAGKYIRHTFLKATASQWTSIIGLANSKTVSFTTPYVATANSVLTIASSRGSFSYNISGTQAAIPTANSGSFDGFPYKEYIISAFADPANPKKYLVIRLVQQFIPFG